METEAVKFPENDDELTAFESELQKSGRGKDTLFRITIRNQVDQIAIADNKANMIITINTLIISLIVAGLGTGMSFDKLNFLQFPQIIAPLTILMVFCTLSAVFAVLAAKPRFLKTPGERDPETTSPLFFGNFKNLSLKDYIGEMYEIIKSKKNTYRSLIIDLYFNGQILSRKYRLLAFSYTSFLIGLVTCVIVYLILTQVT